MKHVWVMGNVSDAEEISRGAARLQDAYSFVIHPLGNSIPLRLLDHQQEALFRADPFSGVCVSTFESTGICAYAGLPRETYLFTAAMLGVLRYRAMRLNPLLCAEDFLHEAPSWCLFARRLFIEEYAIAFEEPRVCRACWQFYGELCPQNEVAAAKSVVEHAAMLAGLSLSRHPAQ